MKVKTEHTVCDVCEGIRYREITEVTFSRDDKDFSFDCCYDCMRGEAIRTVYQKILDFIKGGDD